MNFSRYFCNINQAYLMTINTSLVRIIGILHSLGNTTYRIPPHNELRFILYIQSNIITIDIDTYTKKHHFSNINVVFGENRINPSFSRVKESVDGKTLLITRSVYL